MAKCSIAVTLNIPPYFAPASPLSRLSLFDVLVQSSQSGHTEKTEPLTLIECIMSTDFTYLY